MSPGEDRYERLPLEVRRWLETASSANVTTWANVARWYDELHAKTKFTLVRADEEQQPLILDDKQKEILYDMLQFHYRLTPAARQFLTAADETVFRWLLSMRPEEVELFVRRTKTLLALQTLGRVGQFFIGGIIIGGIAMAAQFGDFIKNMIALFHLTGGK